ncbi:hypothetical protein CALCODRAFT_484433 [Calocera cornea HHB12733]|uniref:Uncharacterized protein n=1 Tax=Calocera cornea HHB12733 TaxID=1353952 RepID=A0A165F003_9BASI|nr:hypothetical protein CALCODRAFT_484433 [Calocera cornea HHB12733]
MAKKKGGGWLSPSTSVEINLSNEAGIDPGPDDPNHDSTSPERDTDNIVRGEATVVKDGSVGQHYYTKNNTALRLREGPVASIATNPAKSAEHAGSVGQHYYTKLALRLWKSPVASIATIQPETADHAISVGQHYYTTTALCLREGPDTTTVSNTTSDSASPADATPTHPSTPQSSISHSANTAAAVAESAVMEDSASPAVPAPSREVIAENVTNVVDAVEPEHTNRDASTEPNFDPPPYEEQDPAAGQHAYESRITTPHLQTIRLQPDSDNDEALPEYRKRELLPPLYSPPRKRRTAAAHATATAAAVPAARATAAAGTAAAGTARTAAGAVSRPAPRPERRLPTNEELRALAKAEAQRIVQERNAKYGVHIPQSNINHHNSNRTISNRA